MRALDHVIDYMHVKLKFGPSLLNTTQNSKHNENIL